MSYQFLVVNNCDKLEINLENPLILDENFDYEMALICLTTYNTIFNVTNKMNIFTINDKEEKFEPGAYEIKQFNPKLQKYGIVITADVSTGKCNMKISDVKIKKEIIDPTTKNQTTETISKNQTLKFDDNSFFIKY